MKNLKKICFIILTFCFMATACKKAKDGSDTKFLELDIFGLTAFSTLPKVTICLSHMGIRDDQIKTAAQVWLNAIGVVSVNPVATVELAAQGSSNCHATVYMEDLGDRPAYTQTTDRPEVHWDMNQSTWFGSYNVLVHEFGHAFGLADTYDTSKGKAGVCVVGQPEDAVMCSPYYKTPQIDDTNGVRTKFKAFLKQVEQQASLKIEKMEDYSNVDKTLLSSSGGESNTNPFDWKPTLTTATVASATPGTSPGATTPGYYCNLPMEILVIPSTVKPTRNGRIGTLAVRVTDRTTVLASATMCVGRATECVTPHASRTLTRTYNIGGEKYYASTQPMTLISTPAAIAAGNAVFAAPSSASTEAGYLPPIQPSGQANSAQTPPAILATSPAIPQVSTPPSSKVFVTVQAVTESGPVYCEREIE